MIRISPEYGGSPEMDPKERDRLEAELHATKEFIDDLDKQKENIFSEIEEKSTSLGDFVSEEEREVIDEELSKLNVKFIELTQKSLNLKKRIEELNKQLGIEE